MISLIFLYNKFLTKLPDQYLIIRIHQAASAHPVILIDYKPPDKFLIIRIHHVKSAPPAILIHYDQCSKSLSTFSPAVTFRGRRF